MMMAHTQLGGQPGRSCFEGGGRRELYTAAMAEVQKRALSVGGGAK
jgi:hypothetical protein